MSPHRHGQIVMMTVLVAGAIVATFAGVALSMVPGERLRQFEQRESAAALSRQAVVEVVAGDSAAAIGRRLAASGVIGSHARFELLALLQGWEQELEPGSYSFESDLTTYEVLRRIHSGETSPLRLVLPEGLRLEQVIERLVAINVAEPAALRAAFREPSDELVAGSHAELRPGGESLEGYLAPSAYAIPLEASADDIARLLLMRFSELLTPDVRDAVESSGRSLHDILTIASIIEREVVEPSEQILVSAVIWNRLAEGMPLQMDSTVQYAVGSAAEWWKRELTGDDLNEPSAYNTYANRGLPPGPIASPGVAAIEAAARPANVPYRYFVAKGDGTHAFAVSYEEHQANVERYLGGSP